MTATGLLDGEDARFKAGTMVMDESGRIAEVVTTNSFAGVNICVLKNEEYGIFEVAETDLLEIW